MNNFIGIDFKYSSNLKEYDFDIIYSGPKIQILIIYNQSNLLYFGVCKLNRENNTINGISRISINGPNYIKSEYKNTILNKNDIDDLLNGLNQTISFIVTDKNGNNNVIKNTIWNYILLENKILNYSNYKIPNYSNLLERK